MEILLHIGGRNEAKSLLSKTLGQSRGGITCMSPVFTAQILGLMLSSEFAQFLRIITVFALCAGMLVLLTLAGKLWMEPQPAPPAPLSF